MIYSRYIFKIISFWCLIFLKTSLSDCRDRRTSVNDAGILYSGETETNWGNRRQLQLQSSEYEAANSLGCIQQYRDITRPYTSHYLNDQLSSSQWQQYDITYVVLKYGWTVLNWILITNFSAPLLKRILSA